MVPKYTGPSNGIEILLYTFAVVERGSIRTTFIIACLFFYDVHIDCAGAFGRILNIKFYLILFFQRIKLPIHQTALMKKYLSSIGVADKTKPSFTHYFFDLSCMHYKIGRA